MDMESAAGLVRLMNRPLQPLAKLRGSLHREVLAAGHAASLSIRTAGCNGRANAGQGVKDIGLEGCRETGCLAYQGVPFESVRGIRG